MSFSLVIIALLCVEAVGDCIVGRVRGVTADGCCSAPLTLSEAQAAAPAVQSILLQLTGTQIDTRAPAAAVHLPAQLPVRGESLTGHTQHCSLTLLQLVSGGRQHRQSGTSRS